MAIIDVDAARTALAMILNDDGWRGTLNRLIWGFSTLRPITAVTGNTDSFEQAIIEEWEEAYQIHNGDLNPFYADWFRWLVGEFQND